MAFQWGGKTWYYSAYNALVDFLSSKGVSYATWATNHPTAAPTFNAALAAPPEYNIGAGYDEAKAASAAAKQYYDTAGGYEPPNYPDPGTGGLGQAPGYGYEPAPSIPGESYPTLDPGQPVPPPSDWAAAPG